MIQEIMFENNYNKFQPDKIKLSKIKEKKFDNILDNKINITRNLLEDLNFEDDVNSILFVFNIIKSMVLEENMANEFNGNTDISDTQEFLNFIDNIDINFENVSEYENHLDTDLKKELFNEFKHFIEEYNSGDINIKSMDNIENDNLKHYIKNTINKLLRQDTNDALGGTSDNIIFDDTAKGNNFANLNAVNPKDNDEIIIEKGTNYNFIEEKDVKDIFNAETNQKSYVDKSLDNSLDNSLFINDNDEQILNKLVSKDDNPTYNKITMFMSQFNKADNDISIGIENNLHISKDNFTGDIIKTVKYMELNNIKNLTVKIMPKELGNIVVKITMEAGLMKASLSASNKETAKILNLNLQDLNNNLNKADIKIQEFTVDIYNGDTSHLKEESNSREENSHNTKKLKAENVGSLEEKTNINEAESILSDQSNVNILA